MASNQIMSEDDVRQYFIQNGGIVRNTDIVTYFRTYLSNPAIRDEARILFKTYVNKLATVKVENGDKFLVLKRQYFPPIDGNGNSGLGPPSQTQLGLPLYPSSSSYTPHSQLSSHLSSTSLHSIPNSNSSSYSSSSAGPTSYNAPPPYGYPPPPPGGSSGSNPSYLRSNSHPQSQHYGSQFSLSSNYADPNQIPSSNYGAPSLSQQSGNYYPQQTPLSSNPQHFYQSQSNSNYTSYPPPPPQNHSQISNYHNPYNNNTTSVNDYPLEYGLPPVPSSNHPGTPPRRFVSPQNSVGSLSSSGSSLSRILPPYRPPPPAPYGSPPSTSLSPQGLPNGRRNSVSSGMASGTSSSSIGGSPYRGAPSYYTNHTNAFNNEPSSPPSMFQYHRSQSGFVLLPFFI